MKATPAGVFTVAAVVSGVVLHALFALVGLTPGREVDLAEQANFELNHTFFLNQVAPRRGRSTARPPALEPEGRQAGGRGP